MLLLKNSEQLRLRARTPVVGRQYVRGRPFHSRLENRPLALLVEVLEELLPIVREIAERDEQPRLLVVVVVAERPFHLGERRTLPVPRPRRLGGRQRALDGFGRSSISKRLVQTADAVVRRRHEHEIAGRPRIEVSVREDAGHPEPRHLLHVVPADHLPLVGEKRIEPGVVGPIADRIVVEIRNRLVQIVQHLRLPVEIHVENVFGQLERERHRVAVVVVRDVVPPVKKWRSGLTRMRHSPAEEVDLPVAPIHLDDGCDERDEMIPDVPDVRAFIHSQAVRQLHQRRRRSRLRRVDGARDVVDGRRLRDEPRRLRIVHVDRARISKFRKIRFVPVEIREQRLRRHGDRDHFAPLFARADRIHPHARARLGEHAHVGVDLFRVGEIVARTGNIAQHRLGSWHRGRRGQIVDEW